MSKRKYVIVLAGENQSNVKREVKGVEKDHYILSDDIKVKKCLCVEVK